VDCRDCACSPLVVYDGFFKAILLFELDRHRAKLRYCNSTCQHDHWRRGHKQMCKKIHRGGNAEQYNADKKYKEAVAVAVEAMRKVRARLHACETPSGDA
jgi:hypothetical protein